MNENKRFMVKPPTLSDDLGIIDFQSGEAMVTIGEIVECLNNLHEENQALKKENHTKRTLLVDELRGLFTMYLTQCRSISEEAIITMIKRDVKKRVFEVFDDD